MKVLVCGPGVIGGYLAHALCEAGDEVTVLARGAWARRLREQGLRMRHHLQRKTTLDHPAVIEAIDPATRYDVAFAVMPWNKMRAFLPQFSKVNARAVVLVGNNMSADESVRAMEAPGRKVLLGFQATAGKRTEGEWICERLGSGGMDLGALHGPVDEETRLLIEGCFRGSGYKLNWQADMEAYLIGHVAAIIPIGYVTYACGGSMKRATRRQRKRMLDASREAYDRLAALGVPVTEDAAWYHPGLKRAAMALCYFFMAKVGTLGELVACAHCRNAVSEMEQLDQAFLRVAGEDWAAHMPSWASLRAEMPSWAELHKKYGN